MSLVEKWNQHIVQGNKLSRELEDFEGIILAGQEASSEVAFVEKGIGATYISVLSPEKMAEFKQAILKAIMDAKTEKELELEKLMGIHKPAIINPAFEQAVKEMESQPKLKSSNQKIEFDIAEMKELYINQKLPLRKIAEHFGCAESTVHKFVKENNLTRAVKSIDPEPCHYPEMTVESVREIYTKGTMSLADSAKYFGVGSNDLHTFIEKHGLKRQVVKSNDPFRDKNKMGKEEFKRKMLNSRK